MLNACRSGGFLEAVNRPAARKIYGSDAWPLFFMASARPEDDALVGGMWKEIFDLLPSVGDFTEKRAATLRRVSSSSAGKSGKAPGVVDGKGVPQQGFYIDPGKDTLHQFFMRCRMGYYEHNTYEVIDRTASYCFPSNVSSVFRRELKVCLTAGEGGLPDFDKIKALQDQYKKRGIEMWDPKDWGSHKVVSLPAAVRRAVRFRATPQLVFGIKVGQRGEVRGARSKAPRPWNSLSSSLSSFLSLSLSLSLSLPLSLCLSFSFFLSRAELPTLTSCGSYSAARSGAKASAELREGSKSSSTCRSSQSRQRQSERGKVSASVEIAW